MTPIINILLNAPKIDTKIYGVSSGFYLPWCFWNFTNSRELPYIDVGKYTASKASTKL
jgi:hypothetical protein